VKAIKTEQMLLRFVATNSIFIHNGYEYKKLGNVSKTGLIKYRYPVLVDVLDSDEISILDGDNLVDVPLKFS